MAVACLVQSHNYYELYARTTRLILGLRPANERWRYFVTTSLIGLILGLRPANERRRYFVTMSLIGRAQA